MLDKLNIEFEELMKRHRRRLLLNKSIHPEFSLISNNEAEKAIAELNQTKTDDELNKSFNNYRNFKRKTFENSNAVEGKKHIKKPGFFYLKIAASLLFIILATYSVYFIAFEFEFNKQKIAQKEIPAISDSTEIVSEITSAKQDTIIIERKLSVPRQVFKMPETFGFSGNKIDTVQVDINYINNYLNREYPELNFKIKNNSRKFLMLILIIILE